MKYSLSMESLKQILRNWSTSIKKGLKIFSSGPRVLIMSGYGINCETESKNAFELAGAKTDIVYINDLISKKKKMSDYDIIMFPGGFSYGDDTGSGQAFANKIKNNLWDDLTEFIDSGKLILGICNGFQIMTHLGLFAGNHGKRINAMESNNSNRYECRWVHIKHNNTNCVFTKGVDVTHLPVAHGEGRFFCDIKTLEELKNNNQVVFTYCDKNGNNAIGQYPLNPNGALADVAGICDKTGRIMGMMPHPERAVYSISEPEFHLKKEITRRKNEEIPEFIESNFKIFKNAVDYCKNNPLVKIPDNKLNVLIIGSGGREHALALKVDESRLLKKLFAIPGNPGISEIAECHDVDIMDDDLLVKFAKKKKIDLVIVGPENPLSNGIVDAFEEYGIRAFGPNKKAAQFEGSKIFARRFMKKYNLPSVEFGEFTDFEEAKKYIEEKGAPIVVKADGLAAGKGAFVAHTTEEAVNFAKECLVDNRFGQASSKLIVEECLIGEEASYLVFMDSETFRPMVYSQDHKPIFEGDKGPNCYSYDTEILTENGWKTFDKLKKNEKVMTFDPKKKVLEFKKPTKIYWMKHNGKMIHFKHRELDLLVTPNHRMLVKNRKTNRIKVLRAEDFKNENEIFLTGSWKGKSLNYFIIDEYDYKFNRKLKKQKINFVDWIRFMGLFLSEGYVTDKKDHRVYICQIKKSKHFEDFKEILSKLPFNFSYDEKYAKFRINSTQLVKLLKKFGTSKEKYIPNYIKNSKKEHILEFLKTFVLGDGSIHQGRMRFHSSSKRMIDDIQELVLKIGKSSIITIDKRTKMLNPINKKYYKANKVYSLDIKPETKVGIRKKDVKEINYKGNIGCVTVPTGFVVVRRNNRVAISGNTGGMGAYSPAPILDGFEEEMEEKIIKPFLKGVKEEGIEYKGVLYVGLMKTNKGLKILEFNCRFGDPETQVILPRLNTDILDVMNAVIDKKLSSIRLEWSDKHCVSVVLASGGYPGRYEKGKEITGLDRINGGVHVIQAGTKKEDGKVLTNGGRVLNIVALGPTLRNAVDKAYSNVPKINFEGMYFRKDIAKKELDRQNV